MVGDSKCPNRFDAFTSAEVAFRAVLESSPPEVVDHFVDLVESLPVASKAHAKKLNVRANVLAKVGGAFMRADLERAIEGQRRLTPRPDRDFLRQFRDLKKRPTKRRLLNILDRDKDEDDLRPAESAISFAVVELGIFGDEIPLDWIAKLGDSPALLRTVAERVCEHFSYKIDSPGRPRNAPLEAYAERLAQIYEELAAKPITYAKATDTSRGRKPGEPYGRGLEFMLAGLRLLDNRSTPHQAAAQIDRIRNAR